MANIEEKIGEVLKNAGKPLSPKEIAQLAGANGNTVRGRLFYLCREGKVEKLQKGVYKCGK